MKFIRAVSFLLLATFLVACNTGPDRRYLDVSMGGNLALPPDLAEIEQESAFKLPAGFSGAESSAEDKVPVLARVESLRLEGSGDFYWLSVEEPVDNLYQLVKNFWFSEGYRLIVDEPVIGIMQTEWLLTEQGHLEEDVAWYRSLLAEDNLSASQDQYRVRIESDQAANTSRIYVAHRGTEYKFILKGSNDSQQAETDANQWRFRQSEPELEIEMLSRLMIYLGLQKAEVEQQVASAKLFSPRASRHIDSGEQSPFLIVRDPYQIAWNRVYHQLERMNFDIESADIGGDFLTKGVIVINTDVTESQEGGGFFSFFSSSTETNKKKIVLNLTEETHELTRVTIKTFGGEYDQSSEGAEFLGLLYQNIK